MKHQILDEFCRVCDYHRKYAIRKLKGPAPEDPRTGRRPRRLVYGPQVVSLLREVWEAAGYPWSVRLQAMVPLWMPWMRKRFHLTPRVEQQLLAISPRQIDRRLAAHKRKHKRRLYGRTKPGSLLKHHIPIRTEAWDVQQPGFAEVDLVSHSGSSEQGEYAHSLNLTDIHSGWVETRAVLGKGQTGVREALNEISSALPFPLRGLDSDNGSEFINHHLWGYCQERQIQFTRGRPYKKDDNAHIEQKNWTHVRKLLGWARYDTEAAVAAINDLYRQEWSWMMNLYQPSVKLLRKVRVGSRLRRQYDWPQTPLDRLRACPSVNQERLQALEQLRERLDPFELSRRIDRKVERIEKLASWRYARSAEQEEEGRRNRRGAPVDAADPAERDRAALTGIRRRRSSVTFSMTRRSAVGLPSQMA